jgi:hypothetical protein
MNEAKDEIQLRDSMKKKHVESIKRWLMKTYDREFDW